MHFFKEYYFSFLINPLFNCFFGLLQIQCKDVLLEDTDVAKALIEYVTQTGIEVLVVGAPAKVGFLRLIFEVLFFYLEN